MYRYIGLIISLLLFSLIGYGAQQNFTVGKQYDVITSSTTIPVRLEVPKNKVLVVEFFSYGCPWCFHLEPTLEKWLQTKPNYVEFERVPVVFEDGWQVYSKAFYTAKALGKLNVITPALFNAIHRQGLDLTSEVAMEKFFQSQGISKQDFDSVYNFSPGIGMELQRANDLMLAYKVFQIPTFIIDGKYMTNALLIQGDDKTLMQVVSFLVQKEHAEQRPSRM